MCVLAEREEGRLRAEIQRLEKELDILKERQNIYEVTQKTIFCSSSPYYISSEVFGFIKE